MSTPTRCSPPRHRPRVFILSDISNEPDDAESLVRYLLYSNQFRTEGLGAVTSTWMKTKVCPQDMHKIVDAYAGAVDNLNAHVDGAAGWAQYPSAEALRALIRSGPSAYGMAAVGDDVPLSDAGALLLERIVAADVEKVDEDPLWILCWGGTNVLASVLNKIRKDFSAEEAARLYSRIRVYAISDQDDTGAWIRNQFPQVFYIVSVHGWNQYGRATWTGISGDKYYKFDKGGPDFSKMTKEWIKENIQIGPLGSAYPDYMFIPEGDTPTFLYLIQNGLGDPEHPDYGSWGGRYAAGEISSDGLRARHYHDAVDTVTGTDGEQHTSNQATIWRWRDAFQNDFAARMQWTLSPDFKKCNHHPVIRLKVDGTDNSNADKDDLSSLAPLRIECEAGSTFTLDASQTYDPDANDTLTFKWWHYREPTATQWWVNAEVEALTITPLDAEGRRVEVKVPPPERCAVDLMTRKAKEKGQVMHLVLEVTDSGTPALTSYRRVLVQCTNKELRGGGGAGAEAVGDVMQGFA